MKLKGLATRPVNGPQRKPSGCPNPREIVALFFNEATPKRAGHLSQHVEACHKCKAAIAALGAAVQKIGDNDTA